MVKSLNYKMNRGKNVIASSLEDFIQINIDQLKKPDDIRYAFIFRQWLNHSIYDF